MKILTKIMDWVMKTHIMPWFLRIGISGFSIALGYSMLMAGTFNPLLLVFWLLGMFIAELITMVEQDLIAFKLHIGGMATEI